MAVALRILNNLLLRELFNMVKESKDKWNIKMEIFIKVNFKTTSITETVYWQHLKVYTQVLSGMAFKMATDSINGKMGQFIVVTITMASDRVTGSFIILKILLWVEAFGKKESLKDKVSMWKPKAKCLNAFGTKEKLLAFENDRLKTKK